MDATRSRERIYEVFADPQLTVGEKIDRALGVGTEYLGLPVGFQTRIEDGTQRIVRATGDHPLIRAGETCPLDEAYCRRTVEMESPLAVQDALASSAMSERAVEAFGLGTYIGARVAVDGETHGTVCFADDEVREGAFTDAESHFVELLAELVGQAVERRAYERELADRERELDERKEIYRAVIDASFDLVFRIDTDGRFTFFSPSIASLLGYDTEQHVGEPFTSVLPDRETAELARELFGRVLSGETVEEQYFPLQHEDGDRVFVDIRVTPLYDGGVPPADRSGDDVVGAVGMVRDATDRYRRERLIGVLNRVLRHNLRNDMNVISGYASVLRDRVTGEEAEFAARIVETGDDLVGLSETARRLEDTLDSPPATSATDVVPVVERVVERVEERYPAASVTVETPGSAVARSAPQLETALRELVDNAAKHAGDRPAVEVTVTAAEERVVITVTDDGPGIPEDERAALGAGEETPLVHGSGLGLWLAHWIVESLDGELEVQNRPGGACVEVRLRAGDA